MKTSDEKTRSAFTLVEMMTGVGCGSMLLAALLAAGVSLQRSFAAVEGYSIATGDQLRVQDYIAMDCRRASSVDTGSWVDSGGGTWTWVSDPAGQTLLVTVPNYYDANGNPLAPSFNSSGKIQYAGGCFDADGNAVACTTTISYYKSGSNFMRQIGTDPAAAKPIATNVANFNVTPLDQSAVNGTVACSITFSPRFVNMPGPGPIAGTTVYAGTFLRNAQARK